MFRLLFSPNVPARAGVHFGTMEINERAGHCVREALVRAHEMQCEQS